ncbi:MAG: hypothetical protein FJZ00_03400 [Candidatus Sericytochromatia bacterium]|uniref:Carboxypeptidase regulatory-like domain-containing protein n=1 Tax=Candidatus Tanganyikabacteria bacterium TaxID=2961651 RepID=A0A938BIA4_9BACT|nr:hypothetical protein [Candidatus Tanganyikabacteria bacterium]
MAALAAAYAGCNVEGTVSGLPRPRASKTPVVATLPSPGPSPSTRVTPKPALTGGVETAGSPGPGASGASGSPSASGSAGAPGRFQLASAQVSGIAGSVAVTVNDAAQSNASTITLLATSASEPQGESFLLTANPPGSGVFRGILSFERVYANDGTTASSAGNGKLAVYAEGNKAADTVTLKYGNDTTTLTYSEPASTVTGIVRVGGAARAKALVTLQKADGTGLATISRTDGDYAFYDVPSGRYVLTINVNGAVPVSATVAVP